MTYSFVKPDAGPSPKDDAPQIRTNFSEWARIFALNHSAMNSQTQGDHTTIIFENLIRGPFITQSLTALFNKNAPSAATGGIQPQLFVKVPDFLPTEWDTTELPQDAPAMQLTYNTVNVAGPQYQTFLPGGYVLYIGSTNNIGMTITLSPTPTKLLLAIATANNLDVNSLPFQVATRITGPDRFVINSNASGTYTFGYYAIAIQ